MKVLNMSNTAKEVPMDEILASIRRIISEDGVPPPPSSVPHIDFNEENELSEEERLAAEWASMCGDDEDDSGDATCSAGTTRILDQDDIDSLLGFDRSDDDGTDNIIKIITSSENVKNYGLRLPLFEKTMEKYSKQDEANIIYNGNPIEVSVDSITTVSNHDYLNSIPLPAIFCLVKIKETEKFIVICYDSAIIYSIIDLSFGGRRGTAAMRIEGRPYTDIEIELIKYTAKKSCKFLSKQFSEIVGKTTFHVVDVFTNPRKIGNHIDLNDMAFLTKLRYDLEDRGGRIELLFTFDSLSPYLEILKQQSNPNIPNPWAETIKSTILESDTKVVIRSDDVEYSLNHLLKMKANDEIKILDKFVACVEDTKLIHFSIFGKPAPLKLSHKMVEDMTEQNGLSINNIPVKVTVVLGEITMPVSDLLKLSKDVLIELSRDVGESVLVLGNNKPIAKGIMVISENKMAVKLTELIK